MAIELIDLGGTANDGTGDSLRTGGQKLNNNFIDLSGRTDALEQAAISGITQDLSYSNGDLSISDGNTVSITGFSDTAHTHLISDITDFTDNSTNWDSSYDDVITGMTVTGTVVKTITLTQRDGGTVSANFTDNSGTGGGSGEEITGATFNTSTGDVNLNTNSGSTITVNIDDRYSLIGHSHVATDITDFDTEVSNNVDVAANTSKTGITATQATNILTNNDKISYTDATTVANTASGLASHSGDTTIHFTQSSISITESQISDLQDYSLNGHTHTGDDVMLANVGGAAYTTAQQMQDVYHSTGLVTGGVISNIGTGAIQVTGGEGYIRAIDSDVATLQAMAWPLNPGITLTDNQLSFIYVEYNAGSPRVIATTVQRTDTNTNLLIGNCFRHGTEIHISDKTSFDVGDHAVKMIKRLQATAPFAKESGGVITEVGTRQLSVSTGVWWEGLKQFTTSPINTSTGGVFTYNYKNNSGGWNEIPSSTTVDNLQYDDGSGTLATLSNTKYGVHWVYLGTDSTLHLVYGQIDGTLTEAESASAPSSLPPYFTDYARLIGKLIILKSSTSITQIISVFSSSLAGSSGIQSVVDDTSPELGGDLVTGTFTVDGRDVSADGATMDSHIGDVNLHFAQSQISIPASQISDFDTEVSNNTSVTANTAKVGITPTQASNIITNNAKISATGTELEPGDIDTLAELNTIITDATLIDTTDARLSDARTPLAHTHVVSAITDFDTEVSSNTSVAANTTHKTSDGTDHSFINQDITTTSSPTFNKVISSSSAVNNNELVRLDQMNSAIAGLRWDDSVDSIFDNTSGLPIAPGNGDRYIAQVTANGWTVNNIYEWTTQPNQWVEFLAEAGMTVSVYSLDSNYTFNGTNWVEFGSTISHNNTSGLQGGTVGEYFHLTSAELTKLGYLTATQAVNLDTMESDIATNNAKVGVTTELKPTDIDTLVELNTIITDATLIDTTDSRLSDARTPLTHTHVAANITDFDTEVSNNSSVVANTAKVTYPSADSTKVGLISVTQAVDLDIMESDIATNNAKVGVTTEEENTINSIVAGEPTGSDVVLNVVSLTQAEYDAGIPVATTQYIITDAPSSSNTDDYVETASFNTTTGDLTLTTLSGNTAIGNLDGRYSLTTHNHSGVYEPADATILKDADLGVTVQAYNANTTVQGNTFNGISQLVQLDVSGKLPAIDGSLLTNLPSGITDHTGLTSIGTNTHAQIDTHIADATVHYTQASISIPASQISDFDTEVSNNTDVAANTAKVTELSPVANTGTVIDLSNYTGNYMNMSAANTATVYTTTGQVLGGHAVVRINAATQPTITGGTLIPGADFVASTDMHMVVQFFGATTQYFFVKLT